MTTIIGVDARDPGFVDALRHAGYNHSIISFQRCPPVANETGKRYSCGKCGSEFVVTRGGEGSITCCSEPMGRKS